MCVVELNIGIPDFENLYVFMELPTLYIWRLIGFTCYRMMIDNLYGLKVI